MLDKISFLNTLKLYLFGELQEQLAKALAVIYED